MRKKKLIAFVAIALIAVTFTACDRTNRENERVANSNNNSMEAVGNTVATYINPTVSDGKIHIETAMLSEHPIYANYDSNGTNIQMIAVTASDGSYRLSLNTCQSCNPSPKAYFVEQNGRLVCQNCGNVFTMDSVGEATRGCNPMNISYEISEDSLTVSTADLDDFADQFTSWSGPIQ